MKYIVIKITETDAHGQHGLEIPFVFPTIAVHATIAEALIPGLSKAWPTAKIEVVSAGFVNATATSCFDSSESLNLKSRGDEDMRLINGSDYGTCIF